MVLIDNVPSPNRDRAQQVREGRLRRSSVAARPRGWQIAGYQPGCGSSTNLPPTSGGWSVPICRLRAPASSSARMVPIASSRLTPLPRAAWGHSLPTGPAPCPNDVRFARAGADRRPEAYGLVPQRPTQGGTVGLRDCWIQKLEEPQEAGHQKTVRVPFGCRSAAILPSEGLRTTYVLVRRSCGKGGNRWGRGRKHDRRYYRRTAQHAAQRKQLR